MISREVRGLERAMDALSARFSAEANNVANANTPGYARQDVNFEDSLAQAIDSEPSDAPDGSDGVSSDGDPLQSIFGGPEKNSTSDMLELFQPSVTATKGRAQRLDGNGTAIEYEMSQMVKTTQKYNTIATQLATQYRTFKYITDQK